ncbi:ABC transporter permease [Streptomyces sp. MBT53]|uniref:ABC transporter permease n=1 Tax=Streptomyces sp. MBT53 TaxID=1488384 RepID=UPI001913CDDA|nr:ABC transporter permease [Streptomyces sp. MBT53]MBK6015423.1 ABC transporter permease [Streptomyces sp. MBT53]
MGRLRWVWVAVLLHAKQLSRSPLEIVISLVDPLVYATLAVYLFRVGGERHSVIEAAVGAGMMAVWASVLFGSGGAVQRQRWQGTLELLMLAPRRPALCFLPITLATAVIGVYGLLATLLWGVVVFGMPLQIANLSAFVVAVLGVVASLGMMGLLLASLFVLLPNANALANTLSYPVWMLSGMLVSLSVLPGWTTPLSDVLPTTWGARAVRQAAEGGPVWPSLGVGVGLGLVCLVAGTVSMTRMERRARAAATLGLA